jgi:hypothetical protein
MAMAPLVHAPFQGLRAEELAASSSVDLGSTERQAIPSHMQNFESAEILVGGQARTVSPSDVLTSAELAALQQVLSSGQQTLQIGALGNAVGGTVNLTGALQQAVHNLMVPSGVTAVHDFASSAVNLSGNLVNAGSFYAVSSNSSTTTATQTSSTNRVPCCPQFYRPVG